MKIFFTFIFLISHLLASQFDHARPIFINTLPKSGSVYIHQVLLEYFNTHHYHIAKGSFPNDCVNKRLLIQFSASNGVAQEHLPATHFNLSLLKNYLKQFIVHVRDPRQALLSFIYHVDSIFENSQWELLELIPPLPVDYFYWDFETKVNWQIEYFYKPSLAWLEDWVKIADQDPELCILFTCYEKMVQDPLTFFRQIVSFYGDDPLSFLESHLIGPQKGILHYRKGECDEWKRVFTRAQQKYVSQLLSDSLKQKFGWN